MCDKLTINNCKVIDVNAGEVFPSGYLTVKQGKFESVLPGKKVSPDMSSFAIDAKGMWAVPGLIDMHVHICEEPDLSNYEYFSRYEDTHIAILRATKNLFTAIQSGITTVRDTGTPRGLSLIIRDAIKQGAAIGPRVFACGNLITAHGGHSSDMGVQVSEIPEIQQAVINEIEAGVDFIKVINDPVFFSHQELSEFVRIASGRGVYVACHAFSYDSIELALNSGVRTIEHAGAISEDLINLIKEKQEPVYIVPTIVSARDCCTQPENLVPIGEEEQELDVFQQWYDDTLTNIPLAIKEGVNICTGSDAGFPPTTFDSVLREIEILHDLGATAYQALSYATIKPAEALGLADQLGAIEVDKIADLVIYPRNPIDDLSVIKEPILVLKDGRVVKNCLQ